MQWKFSKKLITRYKTIKYDGTFAEEESYIIKEIRHNIYVNGEFFASVMLIPEKQKEFTYGFLFTSGIINNSDDVVNYRMCENYNIYVYLKDPRPLGNNSTWTITSGCGGGKVLDKTYDDIKTIDSVFKISAVDILNHFRVLEKESDLHSATRCVHKAYFAGSGGDRITSDDIGRHNTIDKIIGGIVLKGLSSDGILISTGRLTSEMILKCSRAEIPVVVSRTAPSKLGIDLAKKSNMTLAGLTGKKRFTVFHDPGRIE
ncbi:MAG: formate dehydrogenase accessory sulfurtransferase FdhD [Flexistipes sinusarabici]|uniref:Formate dehydrogenase accessory sulfurtransferase FdhD n=1 Tax=Flexistipes sinusarabici TaxID=2352 RepID=A0A5D0MX23_FLESI|nr:formate dehydrogenase accessory sulfurtransferase FdhD [Flexistipes sinusarabici]TYB36689.1 MAG: formate dehydrogenase accessory sulfurtransferase FdhD [Flexistipes sinusarabici]